MAKLPQPVKGSHVLIKIESDTTPGTFVQSCIFALTKALNRTKQLQETLVPDCTQPDKIATRYTDVTGSTNTLQGTSFFEDADEWQRWDDWHNTHSTKRVQIEYYGILDNGTIDLASGPLKMREGDATFTQNSETMNYDSRVQMDGTIDFVDNPVLTDPI
ncbi:MAG: hypothetical protein QNI84_13410 [Henriciella sp.]|nr:hypothetical protein [Henriciella sp.]